MTKHSIWLTVLGVCLAAFVLTGGKTIAGTSPPDPVSVKSAAKSDTGQKICRRPPLEPRPECRPQCRRVYVSRLCKTGRWCYFKAQEQCRCRVRRVGGCWKNCRNLVLKGYCRKGKCGKMVTRCLCVRK